MNELWFANLDRCLRAIQVARVVRAFALVLWPLQAIAAGQSLGATFASITASDWLALVLLSVFSGLVALLHRVKRTLEANAKVLAGVALKPEDEIRIVPWWLFALCHLGGALIAGAIAFFASEAFDLNSWYEALAITLLSWSGAKVADAWADPVVEGAAKRLAGVFGRGKD